MKYILPGLACVLLISCGSDQPTVTQDTMAVVQPSPASISNVQPYRPNIDVTPWDGDLSDAIYWKDSRGENAVIVSVRPQYFWEEENPKAKEFFPKDEDPETLSELTEIFVTHYVLKSGEAQWKQFNQHHDYLFGCCDVFMQYQPSSLQVMDADSNGTGEVLLMYHETEGDGLIGHTFTGTLVLLIDGVSFTREGLTGLGNEINDANDIPNRWVDDPEMSKIYSTAMDEAWKDLYVKKIEQDRAEVTDQNNIDEDGHANHQH